MTFVVIGTLRVKTEQLVEASKRNRMASQPCLEVRIQREGQGV